MAGRPRTLPRDSRDWIPGPPAEVLEALWSGQSSAMAACLSALPQLAPAVDAAIERLKGASGRLVYAGAGSSGMIAALDALDLAPTFSWPEARTVVFVAGALDLERPPDPAAEDDEAGGRARARQAGIGSRGCRARRLGQRRQRLHRRRGRGGPRTAAP